MSKKSSALVLILMICFSVAMSGCRGDGTSQERIQAWRVPQAKVRLTAKIVDLQLAHDEENHHDDVARISIETIDVLEKEETLDLAPYVELVDVEIPADFHYGASGARIIRVAIEEEVHGEAISCRPINRVRLVDEKLEFTEEYCVSEGSGSVETVDLPMLESGDRIEFDLIVAADWIEDQNGMLYANPAKALITEYRKK